MQSLLLKSLVLTCVIGGSCFLVWFANESLQKTQSETDPNQFAALETGEEYQPDAVDESGFETIDLSTETTESSVEPTLAEERSTIPPQSEDEGIEPTLAKTGSLMPLASQNESEETTQEFPSRESFSSDNDVAAAPVVLPDNFHSIDDEQSPAGPNQFPGVAANTETEEEKKTSAPVMPLTFYSAGGNDVPQVELALNEKSELDKETVLPASATAPATAEPLMLGQNEEQGASDQNENNSTDGLSILPGQLEEEVAAVEPGVLRFGPSTKSPEELAATVPPQIEEEEGLVQLGPSNAAPVLPLPTALPVITKPEDEQPNQNESLDLAQATPLLPIQKSDTTSETFGGKSQGESVVSSVATEDNPFAKFNMNRDMSTPNEAVVQTSGVSTSTETPSVGENPFARFQNQPVRTANIETAEPSDIGFNSPPPQPSVPVVENDPFGNDSESLEVMPAPPTELAQNNPVPEELLPPVEPGPFSNDTEISTEPVLPETNDLSAANDEAILPANSGTFPALAEPVPLPSADPPAVSESESVLPAMTPAPASSEKNSDVLPLQTIEDNNTEVEPAWSDLRAAPVPTPTSAEPVLPEPSNAPSGIDNLASEELFPEDVARNQPAPASIEPNVPEAEVMPLDMGSETALAPSATPSTTVEPEPNPISITPREAVAPIGSEKTPPAQANSFQNPANSEEDESFDRSISSTPQSPELKIEKIAPPQASIGEPLIYAIRIQNVGGSDARSVVVEDRIPRGTRLEGTIPQAVLTNEKLSWELGILKPGEVRTIQLKVIPLQAGDIGSVATVSFEAAVAATIRVTAPELSVEIDGPTETLLGKNVPYKFTVHNTGQGDAKDVVLRAILPPSLKHPNGNDIEASLNDIPAGESRTVDLVVVADDVGVFTPKVLIWMNGKDVAENRADLRILESRIRLSRSGPKRRFVGRPAEFVTQVTNDSSIALTNITVEERLPVSLDPASQISGWDPQRRVIQRLIPALQPGETREFTTQLIPNQAGELVGKITVQDQAGNQADLETPLSVKGFADLAVDIHGENKFVVIGDQVSFRLNLKNDGTATANNVQAEFEIPQGLEFAAATGPSTYQVVGNKVQFAAIDQIPVNTEKSYDIVLTAAEECNTKVKIALHSADYNEPINREEPVRVVSDAP